MAIKLEKNKGIILKKEEKGIGYIKVGLGWDSEITIKKKIEKKALFGLISTGQYEEVEEKKKMAIDIDASVLVYNENKRLVGECSYRNKSLNHNNIAVIKHSGDNRSGGQKGDDECIDVFLDRMLNSHISYAYVVLNVYSPNINFDSISNAYVNIYDEKGTTLATYNLTEDYFGKNAIIAAKLVKHTNQNGNSYWEFVALGDGLINANRLEKIINRATDY